MTHHPISDRDLRQRDIVPPDKLSACKATIVGIGAIGRQAALQLSAIGIPWLQLIDPDTVETVNLGPQGYFEDDIGRSKVHATGDVCHQLNHQLELHTRKERFRRSSDIGNVLFCCVDSIETRRMIWQCVKDRVDFFADGRMSAEVLRVLTVCDSASRRHYPTTLFTAGEAFAGTCTAKSTVFCANIAGGLMISQFAKWLRRLPTDPDVQLNLLATEITLAGTHD